MPRQKSPRRIIWDVAQSATIGRELESDVVVATEQAFSAVWYGSSEKDFSFYSHPDYVYLLLNSWRIRSGQDVDFLIKNNLFVQDPKVILDFHGGMGLTAMRLAMQYPHATIVSHSEVAQHRNWCSQIAAELKLQNVVATADLPPADILIAQETMEHIKNPIETIVDLIDKVKPKQYLDGSSFTIDSPGHFTVYTHNGEEIGKKKIKRRFNKALREIGFEEYWTRRPDEKKPFNGRPALFDGPL